MGEKIVSGVDDQDLVIQLEPEVYEVAEGVRIPVGLTFFYRDEKHGAITRTSARKQGLGTKGAQPEKTNLFGRRGYWQ